MSTPQEIAQALKSLNKPRSKYGAIPMVVDNIRFDSRKEARHYLNLKVLQQAEMIAGLEAHPVFPLHSPTPMGKRHAIGVYIADFRYLDLVNSRVVIEDVKSPATRRKELYRWKKKHVEAEYGLEIREV